MQNHFAWAVDLLTNGSVGFYEREFSARLGVISPNYPPIMVYLFTVMLMAEEFIKHSVEVLNYLIPWFPSKVVVFILEMHFIPVLLKLPAMFADLGIAGVMYMFLSKLSKQRWLPLSGALLILFNPAFFYNSAVWGQVDSVPLFFILFAFYLLVFKKNAYISALSLLCALMIKQTSVVVVPLYLVIFYFQYGSITTLKMLALWTIGTWVVFIPFNPTYSLIYPFTTYINKILLVPGLPFASNGAYNWWGVVTQMEKIKDSTLYIFDLSYQVWGYLVYVLLYGVIAVKLVKNKFSPNTILWSLLLILLFTFTFLTKMHERHLLSALPFLLILSYRYKKLLWVFLAFSLYNFLNLYANLGIPDLPLLKKITTTIPVITLLIMSFVLANALLFRYYLLIKLDKK